MPFNITSKFVQSSWCQNTELLAQNTSMLKQFVQLYTTVATSNQTIKELQGQLSKNSKNSSNPPSSNELKKTPVDKTEVFVIKTGKRQSGDK